MFGLLVADRAATKGVVDALTRSLWPLGYVWCTRTGTVRQMLWNRVAAEDGGAVGSFLDGLGVGVVRSDGARGQFDYESGENGAGARAEAEANERLVLTWNGRRLPWVVGDGEADGAR